MAKFSKLIYTSRLLPTGVQDLWVSQCTSDLRLFGIQKPISDVKTLKTSTSASADSIFNSLFTIAIVSIVFRHRDFYRKIAWLAQKES